MLNGHHTKVRDVKLDKNYSNEVTKSLKNSGFFDFYFLYFLFFVKYLKTIVHALMMHPTVFPRIN